MAVALALRRFEEAPERRMRLALAHAVQVEPRLDRELAALELRARSAGPAGPRARRLEQALPPASARA